MESTLPKTLSTNEKFPTYLYDHMGDWIAHMRRESIGKEIVRRYNAHTALVEIVKESLAYRLDGVTQIGRGSRLEDFVNRCHAALKETQP